MIRKSRLNDVIALGLCLGVFGTMDRAAAQTSTQIHPPENAAGGPIVIAVLADNFTSDQEDAFNEAAANLILHGVLADPAIAKHKDGFTVKTIFNPAIDFGFELDPFSNCSLSWDPIKTTQAIVESAGAWRWVVIGNNDYNIGCTSGDWAYVTVGTAGHSVLEHEFGHLVADLYDEYVDAGSENTPHAGLLNDKNCSTSVPPHWNTLGLPNIKSTEGCDHRGKNVMRPSNQCRMLSHGSFCSMCAHLLDRKLTDLKQDKSADASFNRPLLPRLADLRVSTAGFFGQPSKTVQPGRAVQVLLGVTPPKPGAVTKPTIITATDITGPVILRTSRVGDYAFEVSDGNNQLAVGVVTGDPFQVRDYRGGAKHRRPTVDVGTVVVVIPGETREGLVKGPLNVQIVLYRLPPREAQEQRIDGTRFKFLKDNKLVIPVAQVEPQELKERLKQILATK